MAESNEHGIRGVNESLLGILNDDSDEEVDQLDEEMEGGDNKEDAEYEEKTLKEIARLQDDVQKVSEQIRHIIDSTNPKSEYNKIEEYLLQIIIKLDNIDTKNSIPIREARKGVILYTQETLQVLDTKLKSLETKNNGL